MYYLYHYVVDWSKVETLDDLKSILARKGISFEPYENQEGIEHMLQLVSKPSYTNTVHGLTEDTK